MKVYALIGASGSGKSHRATLVAYEKGIEYIIDDGLLIKGSQVLAGRSAKRENTKIGATKRAIFTDPEHAIEVKEALRKAEPESILILGTSRRMVEYITRRLKIPAPLETILIEDIASPAEITQALEVREKKNRHVIPLPTFELEKEFPGYLLDPLKAFFLGKSKAAPARIMEHSIVRPVYSSLGNFYLSTNVVEQITTHIVSGFHDVVKVKKPAINSNNNGLIINLEVHVKYGVNIPGLLQNIQQDVKKNLENLTGLQISKVNIAARKIVLPTGR
ncbi:MAG: Asp23/Gls24 family envelope stress response protein [Firmicutes bacterium]|jgi:ABC-type dipeptide/oligopeptide/nickel transport system ATPase component|nr:Asp23/Gls24 family envelope stress response protein [Bacillota bacterium]